MLSRLYFKLIEKLRFYFVSPSNDLLLFLLERCLFTLIVAFACSRIWDDFSFETLWQSIYFNLLVDIAMLFYMIYKSWSEFHMIQLLINDIAFLMPLNCYLSLWSLVISRISVYLGYLVISCLSTLVTGILDSIVGATIGIYIFFKHLYSAISLGMLIGQTFSTGLNSLFNAFLVALLWPKKTWQKICFLFKNCKKDSRKQIIKHTIINIESF
jgi:hypothetical protein